MKKCPICQNVNNRLERSLNGIDLLRCCNCKFVYVDVSDEQIEKANSCYDDRKALAYENQQTVFDELWFKSISQKFTKQLGPGRVLDIGCGNGLLLKQFKSLKWDCYGVDLSPWSKTYSEKYGFNFYQGKLEEFNWKKERFDLVVSMSTLEHIARPLPHIEEIVKLIKPHGLGFFAGIPNYNSISIMLGLSDFYANMPPGHVNYFTPKTISKLFNSIKDLPGSVEIKTYGVPEMHRIYNFAISIIRRRKRRPNNKQEIIIKKANNKYYIKKLMVYLYYSLGRPFFKGDKLQVTIVK